MKKVTLVGTFLAVSLVTYAAKQYGTSLKNHPIPKAGCYPVSKISVSKAKKLIASQNMKAQNATDDEVRALGAAIHWIQYLNDGVLRSGMAPKGYKVKFISGKSSSSQRVDHIRINKKWGKSVAQHAHEWAHLIGGKGAYDAYKRHMGLPGRGTKSSRTTSYINKFCMVSGYADNNPSQLDYKYVNEQFAEVFTAFVTEPGLLIDSNSGPCQRAFEFFVNWFDAGNRVYECYDDQK